MDKLKKSVETLRKSLPPAKYVDILKKGNESRFPHFISLSVLRKTEFRSTDRKQKSKTRKKKKRWQQILHLFFRGKWNQQR